MAYSWGRISSEARIGADLYGGPCRKGLSYLVLIKKKIGPNLQVLNLNLTTIYLNLKISLTNKTQIAVASKIIKILTMAIVIVDAHALQG